MTISHTTTPGLAATALKVLLAIPRGHATRQVSISVSGARILVLAWLAMSLLAGAALLLLLKK